MFVYKITCKINNMVYIGQTVKKVSARWAQHVCQVRYVNQNDNRKICRFLHRAMAKYGIDNFYIETLEECRSLDELNQKEEEYIKKYNSIAPNGYNLQYGGNNRRHSDATKALLSQKASGPRNGMYGKKGSEKQKEWLRDFNRKPRSEEWVNNCKKAQQLRASLGLNKGFTRKKTPEEIEKTRTKKLKRYAFMSPEGVVHDILDIHEFAKLHGFNARALRKSFQFKKKYKGWTPLYKNEDGTEGTEE